jgi:tRNA(fMet)-specific endonuclease VapC
MEKLPYDTNVNKTAININRKLKQISMQIDIPDLMIAACAITSGAKLATLNSKHFSRIDGLELITNMKE